MAYSVTQLNPSHNLTLLFLARGVETRSVNTLQVVPLSPTI